MKYTLIKTEKQYDEALERLNLIFDASTKSEEGQEAELLALLIENYEEEHHPIEAPDPIVAVRIRMAELVSCWCSAPCHCSRVYFRYRSVTLKYNVAIGNFNLFLLIL